MNEIRVGNQNHKYVLVVVTQVGAEPVIWYLFFAEKGKAIEAEEWLYGSMGDDQERWVSMGRGSGVRFSGKSIVGMAVL